MTINRRFLFKAVLIDIGGVKTYSLDIEKIKSVFSSLVEVDGIYSGSKKALNTKLTDDGIEMYSNDGALISYLKCA